MKHILIIALLFQVSLYANDACTIKQVNNVRKGPAGDEPLIKKLPIYTPLIVLEEQDQWTKVKGVDFEGWIFTSLIDRDTDCLVILDPKKPYCFKQKEKLNRPISFNEGFKIIKKDVGCNLVEGKWGKQIWLNSNNIWPKTAAKLLQI
jgi:hypothetical protein